MAPLQPDAFICCLLWVSKVTFITLLSNITYIIKEIIIFKLRFFYTHLCMYEFDEYSEEMDMPREFRLIQQSIDSFVSIAYNTALSMEESLHPTLENIAVLKGKIQDIIRHNPPLASVPRYCRDNRANFLWYSDFYDDISKEDYRRYRAFTPHTNEITPASYARELVKIDLPYFKELVDLISLERLCQHYENRIPKKEKEGKGTSDKLPDKEKSGRENIETAATTQPTSKIKRISGKRSYEPKLNNKQYALLAECIERIKLFRRPVKVAELRKLLKGKLSGPLQVANQKSLVYLFDLLKENHYIKETWISVAEGNMDFISFRTAGNEQRYGSGPHYITMQQFLNNRARNQKEAIHGLIEIEDMMDLIEENRDK